MATTGLPESGIGSEEGGSRVACHSGRVASTSIEASDHLCHIPLLRVVKIHNSFCSARRYGDIGRICSVCAKARERGKRVQPKLYAIIDACWPPPLSSPAYPVSETADIVAAVNPILILIQKSLRGIYIMNACFTWETTGVRPVRPPLRMASHIGSQSLAQRSAPNTAMPRFCKASSVAGVISKKGKRKNGVLGVIVAFP